MTNARRVAGLAAAAMVLAAGCSSQQDSPQSNQQTNGVDARASLSLPPTDVGFDYQLGGAYPPPDGTRVVTRDSTAQPAAGVFSICYVNGFQSQPGEEDQWSDTDLILRGSDNKALVDPNWPDEFIFDTSTPDKRSAIAETIGKTIDVCARSGFGAVEIDNLDTWTRFPDHLGEESNLLLASVYTQRAHTNGMSIGQKNAPDTAAVGKTRVGFDFAVAEECAVYDECSKYSDVYGPHVIDIEYADALKTTFADVCAAPVRISMTVLRDRELVSAGEPGYVYQRCR